MILAISYADEKFEKALYFNIKRAIKFGCDKGIAYTPNDIPEDFKEEYGDIWHCKRGAGYWIWKPYILLDALSKVNEGDYVVYTDAGSAFVEPIDLLINAMNAAGSEIMPFVTNSIEREWTKRDAFLVMECDSPEYTDTAQFCGGYLIVKKSDYSVQFVKKWQKLVTDNRINTDLDNVLGMPNYVGFKENRHDQTALSLLCKKEGIVPFRDPSEWGLNPSDYADDVIARSSYPQVIESHRRGYIHYSFQLKYKAKPWYPLLKKVVEKIERHI